MDPLAPSSPLAAAHDSDELDDTNTCFQGFGSFHSGNVEELIALPADKYVAPSRPNFAHSIGDSKSLETIALGKALRTALFMVDPSWTFVNHGAFGGVLRGAMEMKHKYEEFMESQILNFVDRELLPLLVHSLRELAAFLRCDASNLALIQNATAGLNAAIHSLVRPKDHVCYLDLEYGSVYKMMVDACQRTGARLNEIELSSMLRCPKIGDNEAVVRHIEQQLPNDCTVFVIDHITSGTALELPVFDIITMLHARGVKKIIVDGAHAPLQIPLNFAALRPDQLPSVYVGNLHKWFCCPKAVAFVWARDDVKKHIHPTNVSHGYGSGFVSEFIWDGTKDYGAWLTIPAMVQFWKSIGVDRCRSYIHKLRDQAIEYLCAQFNVQRVARCSPFMSLVELPRELQPPLVSAKFVQDTLHYKYKVEVPVKEIGNVLYLRVSVMIYNDMSDFEEVARCVGALAEVVGKKRRRSDMPLPEHKHSGGCGTSGTTKGALTAMRAVALDDEL